MILRALLLVAASVTSASAAPSVDPALYAGMKWRAIGPFRGGRVVAVAGVPGDPAAYWFGGVGGGVFKSEDGGAEWTAVSDGAHVAPSIGAIAVADSDHNVIWVGTGEGSIRGNMAWGDGVYRSIDGGRNWSHLGLEDTQHIGALAVDPRDANIAFVAALGHAYGPNAQRGVFRTRNGGKSWDKVLYVDNKTGAIDVVFDPRNPNVLFATTWQVARTPWSLSSGGPGSGIWKSIDGGTTWTRLAGHGLPDGILGRIGVTVSPLDSDRVYAQIEAKEGGLFRSDDAGASWTRVNSDDRFRQRAWYFTHVFASPRSVDELYMLNTGMFKSVDGGKTFALLPAPHGDHHGLWIDPKNADRMIESNDGGVTITVDGGKTWSRQDNQPTGQFYHVVADRDFPRKLYGAQQDNSAVAIKTYSDDGWIGPRDWYPVAGGESGFQAPDPRDSNLVYGGSSGYVVRFDVKARQVVDITPVPLDSTGHGASDFLHRFGWTEPVFLSPNDPDTLYTAGECVWKTTDRGKSWKVISPDLTRNDKTKQKPSGGPITLDITTVEYYDTIFALAESPRHKGMLWAGTDDGRIQLTTDGGGHWTDVTPPRAQLPEWSSVFMFEPSTADARTAFVAVDRHRNDDLKPIVLVTTDEGKSWKRMESGLPDGAVVHAVRQDPKVPSLLYAATEKGVFVSFDGAAGWQPLQLNLAPSPVTDLAIVDDDLAASTNGRGFWVLDDLAPVRALAKDPATRRAEVVLYPPSSFHRLRAGDVVDRPRPLGKNPPNGALINYYLKKKPDTEVAIDILDAKGTPVRHLSSRPPEKVAQPPEWPDLATPEDTIPAQAGMNRFAWNLRWDSPAQIPGAFYSGGEPEGPMVKPGTYTVKLSVGGTRVSQPIEITLDPRVKASPADLDAAFEMARKIVASEDALHRAVNQIRELRAQASIVRRQIADSPKAKEIRGALDALEAKIAPIEESLIQVHMKSSEGNLAFPNELNEEIYGLFYSVDSSDTAPTESVKSVYASLSRQLDEQLAKWKSVSSTDVPALDQKIRALSLPSISVGAGAPVPPAPASSPPTRRQRNEDERKH